MKSISAIVLIIVFAIGLPVMSQDTPTSDFATETAVVFETATPFETATALPTETATATPTPTPVPEPEPPAPTPVDWNLIIPWIGAAILVICIGGFTVLRTALVQLGRSVPLPAWEVGKSFTNTLYDQLMKLFGKTPNQVDDYLGAEGRKQLDDYIKEVERLRGELETVKSQVAQNQTDIQAATQNR